MMNRRQFVGSAGVAFLAGTSRAFAATYDLVIKGGRVIDPSMGLDAIRDVAISGDRIVAVEASIAADAAATIDARGKVVTAGLIDIHTHAGRSKEGPAMCLQDGVTGWADAGLVEGQVRHRRVVRDEDGGCESQPSDPWRGRFQALGSLIHVG